MPSRPAAPCPSCNQLTWKAGRCTTCGYTRQRDYGHPHRAIRQQLAEQYPLGPCWRCGRPGTWHPQDPDPLERGHLDPQGPDTLANSAPEHRSCNRRAAHRDGFGG